MLNLRNQDQEAQQLNFLNQHITPHKNTNYFSYSTIMFFGRLLLHFTLYASTANNHLEWTTHHITVIQKDIFLNHSYYINYASRIPLKKCNKDPNGSKNI